MVRPVPSARTTEAGTSLAFPPKAGTTIGGWAFWCSFNAGYPGFFSPGEWAFTADAFKKAMVWSVLWELLGFGCGWGPMSARFDPWFGGYRHFLRRGTIKLPLFPGAPVIGEGTRGWLDVGLYGANALFLLAALISPQVTPGLLYPVLLLIPASLLPGDKVTTYLGIALAVALLARDWLKVRSARSRAAAASPAATRAAE